jgi:sulfide:quinone oxidoreductase
MRCKRTGYARFNADGTDPRGFTIGVDGDGFAALRRMTDVVGTANRGSRLRSQRRQVPSCGATAGFRVVICGGGIAGVEGLLRLRRLAGDAVDVTLVSPQEEFVYRPLAVFEPFAGVAAQRHPLQRIAADAGARWIQDRVESIDGDARKAHFEDGRELSYDALLLALGGRESSPYENAYVFSDHDAGHGVRAIVEEIELGYLESVAFVVPDWPVWPLPLYELALMTAERARSIGRELLITFITPEGRPLTAFGQPAGDAILRLFEQAGINLHTGVVARVPAAQLVTFGETRLEAQRIITLPKITGPAVRGIPAGWNWSVPIDERCRVRDMDGRVFAAGDATDFVVKHGGIGAQQADIAAAGIAHLAGVGESPPRLQPLIRGKLSTGNGPLYIAAHVTDGLGWRSEVYKQPPWPADEKIVAEELRLYLANLGVSAHSPSPASSETTDTSACDGSAWSG